MAMLAYSNIVDRHSALSIQCVYRDAPPAASCISHHGRKASTISNVQRPSSTGSATYAVTPRCGLFRTPNDPSLFPGIGTRKRQTA